MSSDSELDEFFDAVDDTPEKRLERQTLRRVVEDEEAVDELEKEERELLHLKRLQEERRKKEDQELRSRLKALQMKKMEKTDHKPEYERKDLNERRRRRHEELRKKMAERSDISDSFSTEESDTSESDDYSGGSGSDIENMTRLQDTKSPADRDATYDTNLVVTIPPRSSPRSTSPTVSIPGREPGRDGDSSSGKYGDNMKGSYPEKEKTNTKHLQDLVQESSVPCSAGDNAGIGAVQPVIDVKGIIDNVLQESQLIADDNEPDIVRSTKTRTPPNTLQPATMTTASPTPVPKTTTSEVVTLPPKVEVVGAEAAVFKEPVAPPRRKKKLLSQKNMDTKNTDLLVASQRNSADSQMSTDTISPTEGLPPETLHPDMQLEKLKADLEQCLDLRSVMKGKKHIKMEEAECAAVNTDHDASPTQKQTYEFAPPSSSKTKTSSLERSSKKSSLDRSSSKTSSLEYDMADGRPNSKQSSKGSSLEGEGRKSKSASSDKRSKSSSLEKPERRKSRNHSGHDNLPRKESMKAKQASSTSPMTDAEILETVMVRNLDTGEMVPLKDADQKLPKCVDPLVLHLMKRTNEYIGGGDDSSGKDDDTSSLSSRTTVDGAIRKKGARLKKLFGKKVEKTMDKVKSVADHVMNSEENTTVVEGEVSDDGRKYKFKANHNKKGPYDFGHLKFVQDLSGEHTGAVWCMKFSPCGRLLATGGQDSALRIWVLESAYNYFDDMRQKYIEMKVSPAPSQESLSSIPSVSSDISSLDIGATADMEDDSKGGPFKAKPFCKYRGHSADLLDVSWSKNYFILSSSMDKTVRLWHISRRECLCTFQHMDFVTAIVFHPRDDRYFLSGSLDGKLRLWNIPDKKVTLWNEVGSGSLITTANFCHNGKFAVVGTYDGKCIFYSTEHLKYYTQIHVRSTRGKNSRGKKITGIEPLPGEDKVLVTSNDSRVRLYDLRDLTLTCKYKGPSNTSSQIRASFSQKGKYLICGSEDHFIYMWKTHHEFLKFSSARRDRNDYYEAVKLHNAVVTTTVFAPNPHHFLSTEDGSSSRKSKEAKDATLTRASLQSAAAEANAEFVVSADLLGCIKVIRAK